MARKSLVDIDVMEHLRAGTNVLAVQVSNDRTRPAGLALALRIGYGDGSVVDLTSDGQWVSSTPGPDGWTSAGFDDGNWSPVHDLGQMGRLPWGQVGVRNDLDTAQAAPSPLLRREFQVDKPVVKAMAYISGLGYYELHTNGARVGDRVLDPAFTRYDRRVLYSTHGLTPYLHVGTSALGIMLGSGWYNMHARADWSLDRARPTRLHPERRGLRRALRAGGMGPTGLR